MAEINSEPDIEPQEAGEGAPQVVAKGTSGRKSFAKLRDSLNNRRFLGRLSYR